MKSSTFSGAMALWHVPERLVLVSSVCAKGVPHVITVGWKMRTSFSPPMFAIAIGKERRMHTCIRESGEFVMAVPGADLAEQTVICGTPGDPEEDKFEKCGFRIRASSFIKSPLIESAAANFECKVVSQLDSGDHSLFVGQVLASWVNEDPGKNLILINDSEGYELLSEKAPYRIGVVR